MPARTGKPMVNTMVSWMLGITSRTTLLHYQDALVLMAVSVNALWKIPVGYFLVDGMSGSERVNVVRECFQRLHTTGVHVVSLTCDGPSCHFSMLKDLKGCTLPVYMLYLRHVMDHRVISVCLRTSKAAHYRCTCCISDM